MSNVLYTLHPSFQDRPPLFGLFMDTLLVGGRVPGTSLLASGSPRGS